MKVWIAMECWAHEGETILRVFASKDAAWVFVGEERDFRRWSPNAAHWYDVEEWLVT
jgi:hypothetical protein